MIEEKKRSVKKQTIESKRNSILDNYQKRALLENSKNALHNEAQRKVADKNLKRIGSKNQIKAYLEIVNEIGNKENEIKKNEIESNIKIYP
jgi:hypothetical protein